MARKTSQTIVRESTRVPNLIRYQPGGEYYDRAHINGKLVFKTLAADVFIAPDFLD